MRVLNFSSVRGATPVLLISVLTLGLATSAAADLVVSTTDDQLDGPCVNLTVAAAGPQLSLREAICIANSEPGGETILLAAATYELERAGFDDLNAVGDLDILDDLRIEGVGRTATFVDGAGIDRVFETHAGATVEMVDLTVTGGELEEPFAGPGQSGGGIRNDGELTLTRVGVIGNRASDGADGFLPGDAGSAGGDGGGIFNTGLLTLVDGVVSANAAGDGGEAEGPSLEGGDGGDGGGIANTGTLTVTGTLIADNVAGLGGDDFDSGRGGDGGGLFNQGTATLTASLFVGNVAGASGSGAFAPPAGAGGAIANSGELHVVAVTMSDNQAGAGGSGGGPGGDGGAVWDAGILARYENCTISGNRAGDGFGDGGSGGGMFVDNAGATINNCTIAGNSSGVSGADPPVTAPGGGIDSANAVLSNTILAANQPDQCAGPPISAGWNLETGTDCAFTAAGDLQNANAGLLPLAANGGPVPTHALAAGSEALDSANPAPPSGTPPACETEDARGVARPQGPGCDIGAFERAEAAVIEIPTLTEVTLLVFASLLLAAAVLRLRRSPTAS